MMVRNVEARSLCIKVHRVHKNIIDTRQTVDGEVFEHQLKLLLSFWKSIDLTVLPQECEPKTRLYLIYSQDYGVNS